MPELSLADLTTAAAAAVEPAFIVANTPKLGGVDPLGLRQINFDLMDQVIPGLNNVARHIRPFVGRDMGVASRTTTRRGTWCR